MMSEIKSLATCAFTSMSHLRFLAPRASPTPLPAAGVKEMWIRFPGCWEFDFQIPPSIKQITRKSKGALSEGGDERSRALGGERALWGARRPPRVTDWSGPHWGLIWKGGRGSGIWAALTWLPASPLLGRGLLRARDMRPSPSLPVRPGSAPPPPSSSLCASRLPAFGALLKRPRITSFHLALQKVTSAPPSSMQHVWQGIAMATFLSGLSHYWTAETQSVPELVTAQVNAVRWGLSFL